ncbi:MFS transporter [Gammaproteobacteria bacterium]|nr:MFS transporter [Gammaproteobacteria bacterium]
MWNFFEIVSAAVVLIYYTVENGSDVWMLQRSSYLKPFVYWGVAVSCFSLHLMIQVSSGVLVKQLADELALDTVSAALLMGMVFYPNICLQIPAGIVTDRFGARKVLTLGALTCSLGAFGFSQSETYMQICVFRVIMGAGLSFSFVSMAFLIANWMKRESFSIMFSIAEMIALLSSMYSMQYLALKLPIQGWRYFVVGISGLALFLSVCAFILVKDRPDDMEHDRAKLEISDLFSQLKGFISDHKMWANGIYSGLLFANLTCFVGQLGPSYIEKAAQVSFSEAAAACTMLTLGLVVGCPLVGLVLARVERIHLVLSISALTASIAMSVVVMFPMLSIGLVSVMLFICGLASVAYLIPFTITHFYVRPGSKSTAIGFTNLLSTIFGPLLTLLIGFMIKSHRVANGLEVATVESYQYGMNLLPMIMFLAALVCFFVPQTHRAGLQDDI